MRSQWVGAIRVAAILKCAFSWEKARLGGGDRRAKEAKLE